MKPAPRLAGDAAEALAARHLERAGLSIVARNYRCREGEIDLVAREGMTLVFVEVRLRRSQAYGGARASVDSHKQRRILQAARHYLAGRPDTPCRCDVILLDSLETGAIEWIRNAFGE